MCFCGPMVVWLQRRRRSREMRESAEEQVKGKVGLRDYWFSEEREDAEMKGGCSG